MVAASHVLGYATHANGTVTPAFQKRYRPRSLKGPTIVSFLDTKALSPQADRPC